MVILIAFLFPKLQLQARSVYHLFTRGSSEPDWLHANEGPLKSYIGSNTTKRVMFCCQNTLSDLSMPCTSCKRLVNPFCNLHDAQRSSAEMTMIARNTAHWPVNNFQISRAVPAQAAISRPQEIVRMLSLRFTPPCA
eukprot:4330944-Pleurochrysis_carterae.AAC.1